MSNYLILLVMVVYLVQGFIFIFTKQYGLALTFGAYAISNVGLYLAARGV